MRKVSSLLAALALTAVASASAQAQRFGGQVSWGDDSDLGVGARLEIDMPGKLSKQEPFSRAFFIGQIDYYFWDCDLGTGVDCSWLEINPALAVPIRANNFDPYLGAGLHIARVTTSFGGSSNSETESGLNLLGGIRFPLGGMSAFTELRLGLGGEAEQLALSFGFLFGGTKEPAPPARPTRR